MEEATINEYALNQLARYALTQCRKYLKDPSHQKEFEEWYLRTYGHKWEDREKYRNNTYIPTE